MSVKWLALSRKVTCPFRYAIDRVANVPTVEQRTERVTKTEIVNVGRISPVKLVASVNQALEITRHALRVNVIDTVPRVNNVIRELDSASVNPTLLVRGNFSLGLLKFHRNLCANLKNIKEN